MVSVNLCNTDQGRCERQKFSGIQPLIAAAAGAKDGGDP